jgi:hypothetical protein
MELVKKETNLLIQEIVDKKVKFFEKYLEMPNSIEINAEQFCLLFEHFIGGIPLNIDNNRPKVYGMDIYLSPLVKTNKDINVYYIKEG